MSVLLTGCLVASSNNRKWESRLGAPVALWCARSSVDAAAAVRMLYCSQLLQYDYIEGWRRLSCSSTATSSAPPPPPAPSTPASTNNQQVRSSSSATATNSNHQLGLSEDANGARQSTLSLCLAETASRQQNRALQSSHSSGDKSVRAPVKLESHWRLKPRLCASTLVVFFIPLIGPRQQLAVTLCLWLFTPRSPARTPHRHSSSAPAISASASETPINHGEWSVCYGKVDAKRQWDALGISPARWPRIWPTSFRCQSKFQFLWLL